MVEGEDRFDMWCPLVDKRPRVNYRQSWCDVRFEASYLLPEDLPNGCKDCNEYLAIFAARLGF